MGQQVKISTVVFANGKKRSPSFFVPVGAQAYTVSWPAANAGNALTLERFEPVSSFTTALDDVDDETNPSDSSAGWQQVKLGGGTAPSVLAAASGPASICQFAAGHPFTCIPGRYRLRSLIAMPAAVTFVVTVAVE